MRLFSKLFLIILFASASLISNSQDENFIHSLTPEEQAFLSEHSTFRVTNEDDWPPFDYSEDGVAKGFSIDYLHLVADKLGVEFNYINGFSWEELLAKLKAKEIDIAHTMLVTSERSEYTLFTKPYFVNPYVLVVRKDSPIQSISDLKGKTVATVRGYVQNELLVEHYPDIKIHFVDNADEALRAVSFGQADADIEAFGLVNYGIQANFLTNLKILGDIDDGYFTDSEFCVGVRNDWPLLHSIMQKAMDAVSPEEMTALKSKWFAQLASVSQAKLELTDGEKDWLEQNPVIRITGNPDWLPFEAFTENNKHIGIIADYLRLVEKRLGVQFEVVPTASWSESLETVITKKADIIASDAADAILPTQFDSIHPFLSNSIVVLMREDEPFLNDLHSLK
ncbi:transporter substrate-binding domain-containing protein, partial [bacterium]|nr:transporter substrate-binding domain-containing protein [bacterium]